MSKGYEEEDKGSYFIKHDQITDVVACPGVVFPSLGNSCYVNVDEILDLDYESDYIEEKRTSATRKLIPPKNNTKR